MMKERSQLSLGHYTAKQHKPMFLNRPIHIVVKRDVPFWVWMLLAVAAGATVVAVAAPMVL